MNTQIEAMKLALEALEGVIYRIERDLEHDHEWAVVERELGNEAITALREALAEQPAQQEPFGYFRYDLRLDAWVQNRAGTQGTPFYTSPSQRTWVGLTDEEVMVAAYQAGFDIHEDYENEDDPEAMHWWTPDGEACDDSLLKLRDLIEAKLKEKNNA